MSKTDTTSKLSSLRWEILKKEIDLIDGNIKNLDDIIYKSKNFAWLIWGGSLIIIVRWLNEANVDQQLLIYCTALIPLLFWVMDIQWRKHLKYAGERERIISKFINSEHFLSILEDEGPSKFPVLDPVGWIYTQQSKDNEVISYRNKLDKKHSFYFIDRRKFNLLKVAFYKDAWIFYLAMIVLSLFFGGQFG